MSEAQQWVLDKLEQQLAGRQDDKTPKENLENAYKISKEMEEQGLVNFEEDMDSAFLEYTEALEKGTVKEQLERDIKRAKKDMGQ